MSDEHPLPPASLKILILLADGALPRQNLNAGINRLLETRGFTVTELRPSPFASAKGRRVDFAVITEAGHAYLAAHKQKEAAHGR